MCIIENGHCYIILIIYYTCSSNKLNQFVKLGSWLCINLIIILQNSSREEYEVLITNAVKNVVFISTTCSKNEIKITLNLFYLLLNIIIRLYIVNRWRMIYNQLINHLIYWGRICRNICICPVFIGSQIIYISCQINLIFIR